MPSTFETPALGSSRCAPSVAARTISAAMWRWRTGGLGWSFSRGL